MAAQGGKRGHRAHFFLLLILLLLFCLHRGRSVPVWRPCSAVGGWDAEHHAVMNVVQSERCPVQWCWNTRKQMFTPWITASSLGRAGYLTRKYSLRYILLWRRGQYFYGPFMTVHVAQASHWNYILSLCVVWWGHGKVHNTSGLQMWSLSHKVCNLSQARIGLRTSFKMRMQKNFEKKKEWKNWTQKSTAEFKM